MYIVISRFADKQDCNRIYEAGDEYPRPGLVVSAERIAQLAGSDNRTGHPLIVDADAECEMCVVGGQKPPQDAPKATDEQEPTETEKPAQKPPRGRKKRVGE